MIKNISLYVSPSDLLEVNKYNWYFHKTGKKCYLRGYLKNHRCKGLIYIHHLLLGKPLKGKEIDHIDGNGLNNFRDNIRIVTRTYNNANRKNVKGYSFDKKLKRYVSQIEKDGIRYRLGSFKTEAEAKRAYEIKHIELYGLGFKRDLVHFELI